MSSTSSIWTPTFFYIVILNLCISTTSQCILSGTPLYVREIGESAVLSGSLITTFVIATMTSRTLSGPLVDAYSRRLVLVAGSCSLLAGSLLASFFPSIPMLFISRIMQGIGFAAVHTAVSSATADVLPIERLGEGIGYSTLGLAIGMAMGPSLAIFLTSFDNSEMMSYGFSAVAAIALILSLLIRYEKHPEKLPPTSSYRRLQEEKNKPASERTLAESSKEKISLVERFIEPSALKGGIPMFFIAIALNVFVSHTIPYVNDLGYTNPQVFFLIAALVALVLRMFASKIFDRVNLNKLFLVPVVFGAASFLLVYFVHIEFVYYLAGIGYGIGVGLAVPLLNSVTMKVAPPSRFGAANSLFFLLYDFGVGVGGFMWATLSDTTGFGSIYIGGALCMFVAFLIALWTFPKRV